MTDDVTMAVTGFEVRCGERFVTLVRREQTGLGTVTPMVSWDLYDPLTQTTVATYDDELLPSAQQAAVRYLRGQMEVEKMRADADKACAALIADFTADDQPRHFSVDDLAAT